MKQMTCCAVLSLIAAACYANESNSAAKGEFLGISETEEVVTKTDFDSSGSREVLTVFKDPHSKLSFQIENTNSDRQISSRLRKLRNGNLIIENFGPNGKLVSRVQTDPYGNSKEENF